MADMAVQIYKITHSISFTASQKRTDWMLTFMNVIALKHILSLTVGSYGIFGGIVTPLYALNSICDRRFALRLPFTPFTDGIAFIWI